jgi:diguanylate cyclase (GGDEF)-like protein
VAYRLLQKNYEKFKKYNKADVFGLVFFVNRDGQLLARSGSQTTTPIDFTDRYYYYHLRENSDAHHAIGPLIYARTTQLWVFHMSVPVHEKDGQFAGVLVQQISVDDITRILRLAGDTDDFFQMVSRVGGREALFVFPPPGEADTPSKELQQALFAMRGGPKAKAGSLNVNGHLQALTKPLLVQTANASRYDLETHVTLPVAAVMRGFWQANMVFVVYLSLGLGLSSAIFYYLLGLSQKLANAQEASLYDPLTKIHNRRALDDTLPVLLSESMRAREPISVLFIDIDHFRYFNETYGHESGDTALKAVAHTLADCARRPLDFVCRWGGEEFVIVLPKTNRHAAMQIAQEILTAVRAIHLQTDKGQKQSVTVSIGFVTDVVTTTTKQDDLVDEADKAMLQAKNQGRDQCVEYLLAA